MKKRSLTHRLENSQLTQMALFPIKLMAVLLSMVVLCRYLQCLFQTGTA